MNIIDKMKNEIITEFFYDSGDYDRFISKLEMKRKFSRDLKSYVELKKESKKYWSYMVYWKDGRYIGDYIKPFENTKLNRSIFENGCKILAERFDIYITTGDPAKVPANPPAFGNLTYKPTSNKRDESYGFKKSNPIQVWEVKGEINYLKKLLCHCGSYFNFDRLGSVGEGEDGHIIDLYKISCLVKNHEFKLYFDMYHQIEDNSPPLGFLLGD